MISKCFLLFLALFIPKGLSANGRGTERGDGIKNQGDTTRISQLLERGNYFVYKPGSISSDLDSALRYYKQSISQSQAQRNAQWYNKCSLMLADYYFIKGDIREGEKYYREIITRLLLAGQTREQAETWFRLGKKIPDAFNTNLERKGYAYQQARKIYQLLGDEDKSIEMLLRIARLHVRDMRLEQAKKELKVVLAYYQLHSNPRLFEIFDAFAELSRNQVDLHKELFYRLELVKAMEAAKIMDKADFYYQKLAMVYADLNMFKESMQWGVKAMDVLKKRKDYDDYYGYLSLVIANFIHLNRPAEALVYLTRASAEVPPLYSSHQVDLNENYGDCYLALEEYSKAEDHYLKMMSGYMRNLNYVIPYASKEEMLLDFIHYHYTMGRFYILTGRHQRASTYLSALLHLPPGRIRAVTLSKIHLCQFKIDSAAGRFLKAIGHLERHKQLDDSLFTIAKSRQIEELQFRYETEKKDKELQLRQKNILRLTTRSQIQDSEIKKAAITRNLIIASSLALLLVAYLGVRIKGQHHDRLKAKQEEINGQNVQLKALLFREQSLVIEKEWLIKEIHHRVKNNLQIIISLLNTQSKYLESAEAREAIGESRQRMEVMSMIHSKLYQAGKGGVVYMPGYIRELGLYLSSCFDIAGRISFELFLEEIELDITKAIPIGLILNEMITNSIKYAFGEQGSGQISITLARLSEGNIMLQIADNGTGFHTEIDFSKATTMGLRLIRGLVRQVRGKYKFENLQGVSMTLIFAGDLSQGNS